MKRDGDMVEVRSNPTEKQVAALAVTGELLAVTHLEKGWYIQKMAD